LGFGADGSVAGLGLQREERGPGDEEQLPPYEERLVGSRRNVPSLVLSASPALDGREDNESKRLLGSRLTPPPTPPPPAYRVPLPLAEGRA